ncbi:MAG: radical SAM peptide maturase [bacterium]|nr:radical SAM peptide maturase [bacterium]
MNKVNYKSKINLGGKMMKNSPNVPSFATASENGNHYIYDLNMRRNLLCHPMLYYIFQLSRDGIDMEQWLEEPDNFPVEIEETGTFTRKEAGYYYRKLQHLKEGGFFKGENKNSQRLNARLTPRLVEHMLANLRQVTFEITDACNLKCKYCGYGEFYEDYDSRENINMGVKTAHNLLEYLRKYWNSPMNNSHDRTVFLSFYGGEPLMNMEFVKETVAYAEQMHLLHNRFTFSITTNAMLLEKHMDYLVEKKFRLLISLDGDKNSNGYRVLHNGKPAYERIVANIEALRTKYPDFFMTNVNFNSVFHNKNSVTGLHTYFKESFDKVPSISELNNAGIRESQKEIFMETYSNIRKDLYASEDLSVLEKDMFIRLPDIQGLATMLDLYSGYVFPSCSDLVNSGEEGLRTPTGTCIPFSKKMFVTVKGKILACERIGHQFGLGSVDEGGVSIDCEAISERYNWAFDKLRDMCGRCYNKEACTQCIFNMDIYEHTGRPKCKGFMDAHRFSDFIAGKLSYMEKRPGLYAEVMKEVVIE